MTDTGAMGILRRAREYEDLQSLKRYIARGCKTGKYDPDTYAEIITNFNVTTTGATADEIELDDGITISQIGKTELTLLLAGSADNASTNGKTYTLVYLDQDGVSHTAVGTGTATLNGTPVAFVPAVTDYYQTVSFTASAADANVNVYAATAGIAAIYATISTTTTEATAAQIMGVGAVYGRSHTEHGDADSLVHYMEYINPWGEIKWGICTQTTTSVDEIRFFEGTYSSATDLVTTTTTYVGDFYRSRRIWGTTAPTANSHEWLLTDAACANVDGSGGDIYGIILEGLYQSVKPRYMVPAGYSAWVAQWCVQAPQSAVADSYTFETQFTPKNSSITLTEVFEFVEWTEHSCPVLLDELSEVVFSVTDIATADNVSGYIIIIEVANN